MTPTERLVLDTKIEIYESIIEQGLTFFELEYILEELRSERNQI